MTKKEEKALYDKKYRLKNKESIRSTIKQWVSNNPDKVKARIKRFFAKPENAGKATSYHRKYVLGITAAQYEKRWLEQLGLCAICRGNNKKKELCADHDHYTGNFRGLLCDLCNRGLGFFKDNSENLHTAALYAAGKV